MLFYDGEGIIRLKGRLENSYLPFDTKHPILLNRESYFTRLLMLSICELKQHLMKFVPNTGLVKASKK